MATKTYTQHTAVTTLAAGDKLVMWNASAAGARNITVANFIANSPNGGLAELGAANVFTANQRVSALVGIGDTPTTGQQLRVVAGSTSTIGLVVNSPASVSVNVVQFRYNGSNRFSFAAKSGETSLTLESDNLGNDVVGPAILIGRNTNSGAAGGAAGALRFVRANGSANRFVWIDVAGDVRVGANAPTGSSGTETVTDGSGTVVGTQTSMAAAKLLEDADGSPLESLAAVVEAAQSGLRAWRYKSGGYNNERFPVGLVTDLAPRYGMDRDAAHPAGKSLNVPVAIGDLFRAVAYLATEMGIDIDLTREG